MPRGERIGDAYIRIHADGTGFDREVRREFDPTIKAMGQEHGKAYTKAFNEELERQGKADLFNFAKNIKEAFGKFDAGSEFVDKFEHSLRTLRDRVGSRFGPEVGERLADEIREKMQRGIIATRQDYEAAISDLRPAITRIISEIDRDQQKILDGMLSEQKRRLSEIEKAEAESSSEVLDIKRKENLSIIEMLRERVIETEKTEREQQKIIDRMLTAQKAHLKEIEKSEVESSQEVLAVRRAQAREIIDLVEEQSKAQEDAQKEFHARIGQSRKDFDDLRISIDKYARGVTEAGITQDSLVRQMQRLKAEMRNVGTNTSDTDREFKKFHGTLRTVVPRISRLRQGLFRASDGFGRLFGKGSRNDFLNFIGSVVGGIARLTVSIVTGTAEFVTKFVKGIGSMISGLADFAKVASSQGLKAALIGLVDGFAFMGTTASTSGINLIILAGVMAALAAAAAVAVVAISGLVAILTALISTVAFAAASAIPALVGAFLPLAAGIGVVVAAFQSLTDAQKDALKEDLKPLTDAFKDLGKAAADVLFQDVGKWAKDLTPVIKQLEPGVVGVANAIRNVLGKAIEDAATNPKFEHFIDRMNRFLPNAVRKVGDVFSNVFSGIGGVILAMLPSINRFLGWLGDITEEFSNWANSRKGRAELRDFFRKAGDSAAALGDFLKQVVKFVAQLLDQTREGGDEMFRKMADAVQEMVEWLTSPEGKKAISDWVQFGKDLFDAIGKVVVAAAKLIDTLDNPTSRAVITFLVEQFAVWLHSIDLIVQGLGKIAGAIGSIDLGAIPGFDQAFGAVSDAIGGIFGASKKAEPFVANLAETLKITSGITPEVAEGIRALRDTLDQVTGAATDATRALALQQLQESGMLAVGRQLGFSARQLTQAFSGNQGAIKGLVSQFLNMKGVTAEQRVAFARLMQQLGLNINNLKAERRQIQLNAAATTNYTGKLKGLPKRVKSLILADGIKTSVRGIASVVDKARELAPNLKRRDIKTIISASGVKPTENLIEAVIKKADKLKEKREARIDADISSFEARRKRVEGMLTALDNRPAAKPTVDLNTTPAINQMDALMANLTSRPTVYQDVVVRYSRQGNPGGSNSSDTGGTGGTNERTTNTGRSVTVPSITVVEAADGKATAQELLNRIAALSY